MGVSRPAEELACAKLVLVGCMVLSSQWTEVGGCTEGGKIRLVITTQRNCVINESCNVWVRPSLAFPTPRPQLPASERSG